MSFATDVKNELCDLNFSKSEYIAELAGFFRSNAKITTDKIQLYTENMIISKRVYSMIKKLYGVHSYISTEKSNIFNKNYVYYIEIKDKKDEILKDLSVIDEYGKELDFPKEYIVDGDSEIKAYLRGSFIAKGSINDPATSQYHLEYLFDKRFESVFVQRLLNKYDLNSKILIRDSKYMVYIKDSEKISDFLKLIKATKSVLYYENIKAMHEEKNIINRLNNCEQANIEKIIETCNKQLEDIRKIEEECGLDILDEKLKIAAIYRKKYPETSLSELSEIISTETDSPITKSGLNHRFRKIKEIADKIIK